MTPTEIAQLLSLQVKYVRTEYNLSQEKMAGVLGLSKKTLIQAEKDRALLNWSAVVALCALFRESTVLKSALGEDPMAAVRATAYARLGPQGKACGRHRPNSCPLGENRSFQCPAPRQPAGDGTCSQH